MKLTKNMVFQVVADYYAFFGGNEQSVFEDLIYTAVINDDITPIFANDLHFADYLIFKNKKAGISALNKKYQPAINRAYKYSRKYHGLVNLNDSFDLYSAAARANEKKQANAFDSYLEYFDELPKREQLNFQAQYKNIHGYGA